MLAASSDRTSSVSARVMDAFNTVIVSWRFRTTRQTLGPRRRARPGRRSRPAAVPSPTSSSFFGVVGCARGSTSRCVGEELQRATAAPSASGRRASARSIQPRRAASSSSEPPSSSSSLGEHAGGLDERRVVQQRQRLLRRVGDGARGGAVLARWGVEVRQHRVQERPLPVHVDAAAVLPVVACRRRSRGRGTGCSRSSRRAGTA